MLRVFGDGFSTTSENEGDTLIYTGNAWKKRRARETYAEPFDLSVVRENNSSTLKVLRPHFYLSDDTLHTIPDVSAFEIALPAQGDISIYLSADKDCTPSSYGLAEQMPSGDDKGWCLWTLLSSGVVKEDLRDVVFPRGNKISLDLSSLNWVQNENDEDTLSAQLWHYDEPLSGDIADKSELTATSGWKFPVRPPDGTPHLKYVELSTLSSITGGGGGGGGGCSCDLSVTPPATLSSLGQDLVQIADWTKDNWQTHVPILAPDTAADVNEINLWQGMTPFSLTLTENSIAHGRIEHCFFYYGRELKVVGSGTYYLNGAGTYYLHITTDQYGHYQSATIVRTNT